MERIVELALSNAASAAVLAVVVALVTLRMRRPVVVYALWLAVLLRLVAPPALEIALLPAGGDPLAAQPVAVADADLVGATPAEFQELPSITARRAALGGWGVGIVVAIAVAAVRGLRLRRVLAAGRPVADQLARRLAELGSRIGLRRAPRALCVPAAVPPMLWSLLGTTRLVLPVELMRRLSPEETDALLAHELAHLKRRDHWVRHLELAAGSIFWWHPVVWWATRNVRSSQELCCDQTVGRLLPGRHRAYASCLVKTAEYLSAVGNRPVVAASGMANLRQLKGRIKMIMSGSGDRSLSVPARAAIVVSLLIALAVTPVLTARPASTDDPEHFTGEPITLSLKDAELVDVLGTFANLTGLEILVEPGVGGSVSLDADGEPWDQVLDRMLRDNGFEYALEDERLIVRGGRHPGLEALSESGGPRVVGRIDGQDVYRYLEVDRMTPPVKISGPAPVYPKEAKMEKIMGGVVAECLIDADGSVRDVYVIRSPSDGLSKATIDAVAEWRFEPATLDGVPAAVRYVLTVKYRLE
jgi:TonB family protein